MTGSRSAEDKCPATTRRNFFERRVLAACAAALILCSYPRATAQEEPRFGHSDRLAPFVPTPLDVVEKMLRFAEVDRYDTVYDLGSGDGRIVIMAAQKFGARAVGVELDDDLYKQSMGKIAELGLENKAEILHANMYEADLRHATVVTLYLLTVVNERLRPILEKQLRPGARIVSHDFKVPGWEPTKVVEMTSANGVPHTIYLYVRP